MDSLQSNTPERIGILSNPLSGRNRQKPQSLSRIITNHPGVLQQQVRTPADIHDALARFSRQNISVLVINGGDGSVQAVLTDLFLHSSFATLPTIVVLAGGTTNMIAGDVGMVGSQDRALQRLIQWVTTGHGRVTRLTRAVIRLEVPGHTVKYGMFFGTAGISQSTQYYRKHLHHKKLHGLPGVCLTIGRFLWAVIWRHEQSATPTQITVHLNGKPLEGTNGRCQFMLLLVSTLERLLLGLRPFYGTESGRLRFTAVTSPAKQLPRLLLFLSRGRKPAKATPENGYFFHNTDQLELYLTESVVLDGEVYTPASDKQATVLHYAGEVTFLRIAP